MGGEGRSPPIGTPLRSAIEIRSESSQSSAGNSQPPKKRGTIRGPLVPKTSLRRIASKSGPRSLASAQIPIKPPGLFAALPGTPRSKLAASVEYRRRVRGGRETCAPPHHRRARYVCRCSLRNRTERIDADASFLLESLGQRVARVAEPRDAVGPQMRAPKAGSQCDSIPSHGYSTHHPEGSGAEWMPTGIVRSIRRWSIGSIISWHGRMSRACTRTSTCTLAARCFPKRAFRYWRGAPWWAGSNKWVMYYDKSVQEKLKEYCRNLLTHKNPYRDHLRRVDDPGIAIGRDDE